MRHKRRRRALNNTDGRDRDLSTIDLVNSILDEHPVCYTFIAVYLCVDIVVSHTMDAPSY